MISIPQDILIKSKVPPAIQRCPSRLVKGMVKCGKSCPACPYIQSGREIKIHQRETWKINRKVSCDTFNCVYLIYWEKCGQNYIVETGRLLKNRLSVHRGYIPNQVLSVSTGNHFNLPGHSLAHVKVTILEQVKKNDTMYNEKNTLSINSTHFMKV